MSRLVRAGGVRRLECGQVTVMFAVAAMAMMGMLALLVDVGLMSMQRRFDQNAADAAALAAARLLANAVNPYSTGPSTLAVYFGIDDADVLDVAESYATGGSNQHAGFASRTDRAVTLEYSPDGGATWCFSRAHDGSAAVRAANGECLPQGPVEAGTPYTVLPPLPAPDAPYLVRVSVSSTTSGFFAQVIGAGSAGSDSCVRVARVGGGLVTCATATAGVWGMPGLPPGLRVYPPSVAFCDVRDLAGAAPGRVFELWGNDVGDCAGVSNSWKGLIDFTPQDDAYPERWHGSGFTPDPSCPGPGQGCPSGSGNNATTGRIIYWLSKGFGGTVRKENFLAPGPPGMRTGAIADGFYGPNDTGTYFFDDDHIVFPCRDPLLPVNPSDIGCRDAGVIAWDVAAWGGGGHPEKLEVVAFYVFRFYCQGSSASTCTSKPRGHAALPGCSNGQSGICARFISQFQPQSCPACTVGPSPTGNTVRLQQ